MFPPSNAASIFPSNSDTEAAVKYEFVKQWIQKTLSRSEQLNKKELEAGEAYLLLDLTYKLDYLISPEGFMMETLERTHRRYFSRDGHSVKEKSQVMRNEFEQILNKNLVSQNHIHHNHKPNQFPFLHL